VQQYDVPNSSLSIFPNPTNGFINLNLPDAEHQDLYINIFDLNGRLLKSLDFSRNNPTINISDLPNSMYILVIESNGTILVSKKVLKWGFGF
jgi:hypothetical protein